MTSSQKVWGFAAMVGLGALAYTQSGLPSAHLEHQQSGSSAEERAPESHHEEVEALRRDVRGLAQELALLRQVQADRPPVSPPQEEDSADPEGVAPDAQALARLELLESSLDGERPDPEWGRETEHLLAESLTDETFTGSTVLEAECGSSLCRAEVYHPDRASMETFLEKAPRTPPWNTQGFIQFDEGDDGAVAMTVFVARDGHQLPTVLVADR